MKALSNRDRSRGMQSAPDSITTDALVQSSLGVEYGRG